MVRKVIVILSVLMLVFIAGCSSSAAGKNQPASANLSMLRKATIGSKWEMNQINVDVQSAGELPIVIKVAEGDKVDGYFYSPAGDSLAFSIAGNSTVYQSVADASGKITSDRFSFTATKDQGNMYSLTFKNNSGQKANVFLEMVFPAGDALFIPMAIK